MAKHDDLIAGMQQQLSVMQQQTKRMEERAAHPSVSSGGNSGTQSPPRQPVQEERGAEPSYNQTYETTAEETQEKSPRQLGKLGGIFGKVKKQKKEPSVVKGKQKPILSLRSIKWGNVSFTFLVAGGLLGAFLSAAPNVTMIIISYKFIPFLTGGYLAFRWYLIRKRYKSVDYALESNITDIIDEYEKLIILAIAFVVMYALGLWFPDLIKLVWSWFSSVTGG